MLVCGGGTGGGGGELFPSSIFLLRACDFVTFKLDIT
jgi:hypothetical protein